MVQSNSESFVESPQPFLTTCSSFSLWRIFSLDPLARSHDATLFDCPLSLHSESWRRDCLCFSTITCYALKHRKWITFQPSFWRVKWVHSFRGLCAPGPVYPSNLLWLCSRLSVPLLQWEAVALQMWVGINISSDLLAVPLLMQLSMDFTFACAHCWLLQPAVHQSPAVLLCRAAFQTTGPWLIQMQNQCFPLEKDTFIF